MTRHYCDRCGESLLGGETYTNGLSLNGRTQHVPKTPGDGWLPQSFVHYLPGEFCPRCFSRALSALKAALDGPEVKQ